MNCLEKGKKRKEKKRKNMYEQNYHYYWFLTKIDSIIN
jgi:hypothetical protein